MYVVGIKNTISILYSYRVRWRVVEYKVQISFSHLNTY